MLTVPDDVAALPVPDGVLPDTNFIIFFNQTYGVIIRSKCLEETIRTNGDTIGFGQEIRKLAF